MSEKTLGQEDDKIEINYSKDAHITELEEKILEIKQELRYLENGLDEIGGCTDGHCVISFSRVDQYPKGGCKCSQDSDKSDRAFRSFYYFRRRMRILK